jgi:2-oxoglutarate dehydrogenase E2 component (dihydrolipoamide succinyltransferase)
MDGMGVSDAPVAKLTEMETPMEIKIPQVGESVVEATVAKWHKKDGDTVRTDDLLCELETDKISLELHAEADGLLSIKVPEGETVEIGTIVGVIKEGEEKEETVPPKKPAEKKRAAAEEPVEKEREAQAEPAAESTQVEPAAKEPAEKKERAVTPSPSGEVEEGRITRKPMSAIRRKIAERLMQARQQTAMLTTFNEADMSRVLSLRQKHRESFHKKHQVELGFMSFFVRAVVEALKEYPDVNARIEGNDIVYQHFYDIGIAVGSERGLLVPVIRNADHLHFADIERNIADFVEKIKTNRITLAELEGGTFTISNGGVYGSMLSTPILNPPQSAVLGMHRIQDRPVAQEGEILIRPMMYLALSYDHRIIDGRQSVQFLKRIKEYIEEPEELLLEL